MAGGFVAVDERDGTPCTSNGCSAPPTMTSSGASRASQLAADEALLEGAYTPASHRGLGIMPAAMALIAEKPRRSAPGHVIDFVDGTTSLR